MLLKVPNISLATWRISFSHMAISTPNRFGEVASERTSTLKKRKEDSCCRARCLPGAKKGGWLLQSVLRPTRQGRTAAAAERAASKERRKKDGCCGARCVLGDKEGRRLLRSALLPGEKEGGRLL